MRILFATPPGYGLMLPLVPLAWAARAAGHEVLIATTAEMTEVAARCGLGVVDVFPDRDVWDELIGKIADQFRDGRPGAPDNPFGVFARTMTAGTIAAGQRFGADLVVYSSDHAAGGLAAVALHRPALEVGNRITWSVRDGESWVGRWPLTGEALVDQVRAELDIPGGMPDLIARIDLRPPSMGGLINDEIDRHDGVPWWPMWYVPFNGSAVLPDWALSRPERPRVCVTLGTLVPVLSGVSSLAVVIEALGAMDIEVILATGDIDLTGLGALPDNVRPVGFVPLSGFLSTCSLIVHHGGSGTTAAPLHYGVPQLVLPSWADNPMAAQRVVDRGVGLAQELAEIDVPTVRELAARLLTNPEFTLAANQVRAEMAEQPSPAAILERVGTAMRTGRQPTPTALAATTTND